MSDEVFFEAEFFNKCITTETIAKEIGLTIEYDHSDRFIIKKNDKNVGYYETLKEINAFIDGYLEKQAEVNNG